MNIRLDAFICYTELVPDCALGEAFEYDRSTNILLLERVYAGGPGLDAAMLCFGNRLVGVNEASIPYNRNILSSFAAGSYALEYDHCGRQVAKYCCGMMDSEIAEFASVCRTASLTTAADEYDRGGYALSPVPTAWPGDVVWAKYYDDYRFVAVRGLGTDFAFEASASAPFYASATGLLTGMYTGSGYEAYYYDAEGREVQRYATGYNRGRRCTAYNYDGTIASRTYSYKESYLPDMEEVYVYDSCGRLTSTTIRVDKAVPVPVLNPAAGQDAADSEATDTASPAASSRWATAVIRREYDAIGRLARLRHGDAAVTEYSYDVHSWPVSQQTTYGMGSNSSSIGYTLEYAPCYNGNISKRTWDEGGYAYTYDALNRLESAVFTPAEGLADRPAVESDRIPDFSVYYDYDLRGNTTNVVRYGVVDAVSDFDRVETFGTLDELACSYDGNRLSNVTAITEALPFDGVTGLHADGEFELAYNDAGDMVSDASRGLLYTRWNADGHPMQYDLEGGHRQLLGWDAFGNHLYTSYETSVAPVSAGMRPGRTRRDGLREYVYGARMFVPSETRFNSMDKLCEKHPDQSPYLFCGGNPIRYGDDSGNDYHVKVNHEEQTITISADYYAYKRDVQSVTAAIGFWNDLSGQYAMDGYTVNFALAYHEVEPYKTGGKELDQRKSINYAMGGDASANAYMVIHDSESSSVINEDGQTSSGGYNNRGISISEKNAGELTGAHEVGHSLGLLHSDYGLMYPLGNSYKRTSDVSKSEVKAIIKQAFTGKVPKDGKEAEPGRGYLDNEEEIKKIEWKYEVRKKQ